jgi:hypothetical protein
MARATLTGGRWDGREITGVSEPAPLQICVAADPAETAADPGTDPAILVTAHLYRLRAGSGPLLYDYAGTF